MRIALAALPLTLLAAPVAAQPAAPQLPPELADPALGQKLGKMAGALSRALMDVKVGEIAAAVEGREASPAERNRTVRDLAGGGIDPRSVERQVEAAAPAMQKGMQAMMKALPAMMAAMEGAMDEVDRATANLPQPGYPRR